MPLYESLDAVPEAQRDAALETKDGKFVVEEDFKDTVRKERDRAEREEKARKLADKRVKELADKIAEMEQEVTASKSGLSSEKLAEIRTQAEAKFKADLEERDRLRAEVRALKLDGTVKSLLAKADAVDVEDAWKIVGGEFDLTEDGKPILKSDPTTDIEKYVASLRTSKAHLFKGTQASGGGAAGQQRGGAPTVGTKKPSDWTAEERQAYKEQHGEGAFDEALRQQIREAAKPKAA